MEDVTEANGIASISDSHGPDVLLDSTPFYSAGSGITEEEGYTFSTFACHFA